MWVKLLPIPGVFAIDGKSQKILPVFGGAGIPEYGSKKLRKTEKYLGIPENDAGDRMTERLAHGKMELPLGATPPEGWKFGLDPRMIRSICFK
jgi:hypothetical protein